MLTRIDHVGIAVRSLDEAIELYTSTFGLVVVDRGSHEDQGVHEAMLVVNDGSGSATALGGSYVQLLEPLRPDSPVGKFSGAKARGPFTSGTAWPTSRPRSTRSAPRGCGWSTSGRGTGRWAPRSRSCTRRISAACSLSSCKRSLTRTGTAVKRPGRRHARFDLRRRAGVVAVSATVKTLPAPGSLVAESRPPCASTSSFASVKPMPLELSPCCGFVPGTR